MNTLDRLMMLLPVQASGRLGALRDEVMEVRLRAGRSVQLIHPNGDELVGEALTQETLKKILAALMDYSLYAREDELKKGFFTMDDGCRVGVCGRTAVVGNEIVGLTAIGSVCVRIGREIQGCADALLPYVARDGGARSMLLISPPGMGKTTCLRDLARQMSDLGLCVGIADERHEIAACHQGIPSVNVGTRTDVMDGCPKWLAIQQMIRSMAPQAIITDEIGGTKDAQVLADAARCGIAVIASAHAGTFEDLELRTCLSDIMRGGIFSTVALLGGHPGNVLEIRRYRGWSEGGIAWKSE